MDSVLAAQRPAMSAANALPDAVAEANHRIANSLALLVSMVRMQAIGLKKRPGPFSQQDVRQMLEGVAARISTIGQLHRLLSQATIEGAISLRPHLKEVTDSLVAALSSSDQLVRVDHGGDNCLVLTRHVQPIVLILCEIFINAMKYAHPSGVPLVMRVDCVTGGDGRLVIAISDDGVGLPEGFDQTGGLGFRVMRNLATDIGAHLDIQSSSLGVTFRLSLPAAAMPGRLS